MTEEMGNTERLKLQEAIAARNGFALQAPIYALGTRVVKLGQDNFMKSRRAFESLPYAHEVFAPFLARVAAERRRDATVIVNELMMLPDGRITRLGNGGKTLYLPPPEESNTLKQLIGRTVCPEPYAAATYVATLPPDKRAEQMNYWFTKTNSERTAVLRTRLMPDTNDVFTVNSEREVYGVVSEKYVTGMEVDRIADLVTQAMYEELLPGDSRAQVMYDGRKVGIQIMWHSNIQPRDVCAGEVFKAGVGLYSADDGGMCITGESELWRNLCLNLIILQQAKQQLGKRRHLGEKADLMQWMYETLKRGANSVREFAVMWDVARARRLGNECASIPKDVAWTDENKIVAGVFRGLIKNGRLSLPGYRGESAVEQFLRSYQKEPSYNRAGVVNAITRTAHEVGLKGLWSGNEMEKQAGDILQSRRGFEYVEKGEVF